MHAFYFQPKIPNHATLPVIPGRGGCRNEKNPESAFASSMNKSSGTRMAPCAPTASMATPNAWSITEPADDMKNTAKIDAPLMPSIFSLSLTGRSPILSGSVLTKYTYVQLAAIAANTINELGLVIMKNANTSAEPRK